MSTQWGYVHLEEEEPLVRDIDGEVAAESPVLLNRLAPAGEGVLVHLRGA